MARRPDPANAVRWIVADAVVPDVRRGVIGLEVAGVTTATVDAAATQVRPALVARDMRDKLGGTPRREISTAPVHAGTRDVRSCSRWDVVEKMAVEKLAPRRGVDPIL